MVCGGIVDGGPGTLVEIPKADQLGLGAYRRQRLQ